MTAMPTLLLVMASIMIFLTVYTVLLRLVQLPALGLLQTKSNASPLHRSALLKETTSKR